jgi:helix-turn-helix, Psq domain
MGLLVSRIRGFLPPHRFHRWVGHTVVANFQYPPVLQLFPPHNMPKAPDEAESRMIEACEAARREKKPNISKIAREYGVNRRTLYERVKRGRDARMARKPVNKALEGY